MTSSTQAAKPLTKHTGNIGDNNTGNADDKTPTKQVTQEAMVKAIVTKLKYNKMMHIRHSQFILRYAISS